VNKRPRDLVETRQRRSQAAKRSWSDPEVRRRRSEAMKRGWADPKGHQRRIEAAKRFLANPKVRQRRIEALRQPEVRQRRTEALRQPEVRQRISEGVKASWTTERRVTQSRWSTKLWEERNAALKAAGQWPVDWWEKPVKWRIIGDILLSRDGSMSNQELGKTLDTAQLIQCPYSDTWEAALSSGATAKSNAATALVGKVRRWVNKPGNSGRAKIAVNYFSQSA
jgi:hypothetical protein